MKTADKQWLFAALAAAAWSAVAIVDWIVRPTHTTTAILSTVCAVIFTVTAVIYWRKSHSNRR